MATSTSDSQRGADSVEVSGEVPPLRFSQDEEATLLADSAALKTEANAFFASADYVAALAKYADALESCPTYLPAVRAVLHCNAAACHLKLCAWKEAIREAGDALKCLDERVGQVRKEVGGGTEQEDSGETEKLDGTQHDRVEESRIKQADDVSQTDHHTTSPAAPFQETIEIPRQQPQPSKFTMSQNKYQQKLQEQQQQQQQQKQQQQPQPPIPPADEPDLVPIRVKALMRRAAARTELGGWHELVGAEEDYNLLAALPDDAVRPLDRSVVRRRLRELPPRTADAREREMGEMWGKLKELGNGILKPFGMSTDNFQMVKDEQTGGYSMNFRQNGAT